MGLNTLEFDITPFAGMMRRLDHMGMNTKKAVEEIVSKAADKISDDTKAALASKYLPAQGKYSHGGTLETVIEGRKPSWQGLTCEAEIGFAEGGAGGYLITGTPKFEPDKKLNQMYRRKTYMKKLRNDVNNEMRKYLDDEWEGRQS